jgi:hypothetical protein
VNTSSKHSWQLALWAKQGAGANKNFCAGASEKKSSRGQLAVGKEHSGKQIRHQASRQGSRQAGKASGKHQET